MDNKNHIMTNTAEIIVENNESGESKLNFTLEIYEGPLDLLLALIAKIKINF